MVLRKKAGSLTREEKTAVKALLTKGWRNQDIQALLNQSRKATINSARITEVKTNPHVKEMSAEKLQHFLVRKRSYDYKTGLNLYDDERLIRSREAMMLAVQLFNNPLIEFKGEVFAVLANIAWTYLMLEHYKRKRISIVRNDGLTLALSEMIARNDCPLSPGTIENLKAIKEIRDLVEHKLLVRSDAKWLPLFQACCLNFEKTICDLFSDKLSLQGDLSLALQFAKLNIEQIELLHSYDLSPELEALDAQLNSDLPDELAQDLDYRFRVVYTLDNASRNKAHIEFLNPGSEEAKEVQNVLIKHRAADDLYPFKPREAAKEIARLSGKTFKEHNNTQAWKFFKVRPKSGAKRPSDTSKEYCMYHQAHRDYTYSVKWTEYVAEQIQNDEVFEKIKACR